MRLEARSTNCFSSKYLLKLDGRPVGRIRGRWFGEGIEIQFTERLQLRFEKTSWLGSEYRLFDASAGNVLATAQRASFFTRTWNLDLGTGPAKLVRASLFSSVFELRQGTQSVAQASRFGWCEEGWRVEDNGTLDATDLVFVGLVYHTILRRQRSSQNSMNTG